MTRKATIWWCLAAVAATVAAAIGFEAWSRPARAAARATRLALAEGRFAVASAAAAQWIRLRPHSAEAQFCRAKAAIALGRSRDIAEGIKRAEALGYPADGLALLRALLDAQHGRIPQARPVLTRAFAQPHPPDPMLNEALARVLLDVYDFAHAGAVLDRWAKDAPRDVRPPLWHARVHLRRNAEPAVVLADYREALRRDPRRFEARLGEAEQLDRLQRDTEAAAAYEAALALRPDDPAAHLGAGRNALALGDQAAAARHLARAVALDPNNGLAHLEHAKLDLLRGSTREALAQLDRAVALVPADPAVHYQRSLTLKRLGRDDEAAAEQHTFARLQSDRRRLDELQERLSESPDDSSLQARIARWMFDHGYDDEALLWCRKILTDTPGHPDTCVLMADYYERRGDADKASAYRRLAAGQTSR